MGSLLGLPLLEAAETSPKELAGYDYLLIGSPVYMGKLLIKHWLESGRKYIEDKELLFFVVSATPDSEREKQDEILRANIPADLRAPRNVFFLPGRVTIENLSWYDKFFLKMGARRQRDKAKKEAMTHDSDNVSKENLINIVKRVMELQLGSAATV
jgi:menaquinone-dependent protoporphyrinogen IX oxidase